MPKAQAFCDKLHHVLLLNFVETVLKITGFRFFKYLTCTHIKCVRTYANLHKNELFYILPP